MGFYPTDSVQEVAQSLALEPLGSGAAELLAGDVEYRLNLILQEAKKFMVHGKRTTLKPEDVEHAMEALNVEPVLVPARPLPQQAFEAVSIPTSNNTMQHVYHVPDDEIDFATYLHRPLPAGVQNAGGVKWKAHWLAVEGVQPAIPENPAPNARAGPSRQPPVPQTGPSSLRPTAKSHLPQELQLYFTRLTSALVPSVNILPVIPPPIEPDGQLPDAERLRQAALTSVSSDQAMAGILVYFVKWLADSVQKCLMSSVGTLWCLADTVEAVLGNESVFLEPYIHQLLPPLLSMILTVPLGPAPGTQPPPPSSVPSPFDLRARASDILARIASTFGPSYANLVPRITSTLAGALKSQPFPSPLGPSMPPAGRYEGAVLALAALGSSAVRSVIWGKAGDGIRQVDELCGTLYPEQKKGKLPLLRALVKALSTLAQPKPTDPSVPIPAVPPNMAELFGPFLAQGVQKRPWLANELVRLRQEELAQETG